MRRYCNFSSFLGRCLRVYDSNHFHSSMYRISSSPYGNERWFDIATHVEERDGDKASEEWCGLAASRFSFTLSHISLQEVMNFWRPPMMVGFPKKTSYKKRGRRRTPRCHRWWSVYSEIISFPYFIGRFREFRTSWGISSILMGEIFMKTLLCLGWRQMPCLYTKMAPSTFGPKCVQVSFCTKVPYKIHYFRSDQ